ncbi:MAG TPA: hypothetical protein VLB46_22445 [Pyrinomonadaceae bacterium]|nr:hypothetical protein [Pyrinomonadaceae bacterium]
MTDEHITAYLLEELSEEESEQFEEQCFAQDEWPAEIDAVEQDLIDAYLRNELSADRRRRFEERYLTTDARKARVLTAKSLHGTLCPAQPKSGWREWLYAFFQRPLVPQTAIAILVLAVGLSLVVPLIRGPRSPQTFTPVELAMSASSNRASGVQPLKVSLPLSNDALRISLKLPAPAPGSAGYRVEWENAKEPLRELPIESQDAQSVVVIIPAAELTPGQYWLKLSNKNGVIGNYFFDAE